MTRFLLAGLPALGLVIALAAAPPAAEAQSPAPAAVAGPLNITLPPDWESRFIRYATVDKADRKIIRFLYVNPEAFAAARPGQPLPNDTLIVMADRRARLGPDGNPLVDQQGRFIADTPIIAIGVQQKRQGWGASYPAEWRNADWEYARFTADGSRPANSSTPDSMRACFTCHIQVRASEDFAFNFWDYVQTRR